MIAGVTNRRYWCCVWNSKRLTHASSPLLHCTDTLLQVASSFSTEPNLDTVLSSIPTRIFEAVGYLQDNVDKFTAKVRCYKVQRHLWRLNVNVM